MKISDLNDVILPSGITFPDHAQFYRHQEGYIRIETRDETGKTRRMMLHRFVWEQLVGPIPPGCVLHHIDGDPTNNKLPNLQLMPRSEHSKLHREHPELRSKPAAEFYAKIIGQNKRKCKRYRERRKFEQLLAAA